MLEIQSLAVRETVEETKENKVSSVKLNLSVQHITPTTPNKKQAETAEPTSDVSQNEYFINASEKGCNCQKQINMLLNRISALENSWS